MKTNENKHEFIAFKKIPRLSRECVISEKLDGTNAQIYIAKLESEEDAPIHALFNWANNGESYIMCAGSRNRWLTPEKDNYGFAEWVCENAHELTKLGEGRHFGEFWGQGIQRNYGLKEKRFSLFNTGRWRGKDDESNDKETPPSCCHVVPILYQGEFTNDAVDNCLGCINAAGSVAANGFKNPEGIVIYHIAANQYFKKAIENDHQPKGK